MIKKYILTKYDILNIMFIKQAVIKNIVSYLSLLIIDSNTVN